MTKSDVANPKIFERRAATAIQENRVVPSVLSGLSAFSRDFTVLCSSSAGCAKRSFPEYHSLNSFFVSFRFLRAFPSKMVNVSARTSSKMARSPSLPSNSEGHNAGDKSETLAFPELQMNPKPLTASLDQSITSALGLDETASLTSL